MAVTQHVIRQPLDTISEFTPTSPSRGYRERHPYVKQFCLWNTFGSNPTQPERELYTEHGLGQPVYHFDRLTVHIDAILQEGMIPFLVLGSCPLALAKTPLRISYQMGVVTTDHQISSRIRFPPWVISSTTRMPVCMC